MNFAIILSGGIGTRLGAKVPKQYLTVKGKPIILYTLEKFCAVKEIDKIIIVAAEQWRAKIVEWVENDGIELTYQFATPGETRQESIINGLNIGLEYGDNDKVIIHDAVRPLVSSEMIKRCLDVLDKEDAVMPVLPAQDTMYMSEDGSQI